MYSAQFLIALPTSTGILPNKVLLEMFPLYIGLPSPAMRPFVDEPHYIGHHSQEVDEFGDSVARAMLAGGDFIRSHGEMQTLMNDIFKKAGFVTTLEAANMFHGKVPNNILKEYVRKFRHKDAVIPDILIHNYSPDVNASGASTMQAIFDVKTIRVDKPNAATGQGVMYKTTLQAFEKPATEIRATGCRRQYATHTSKLDRDLGQPPDNPRPFTNALNSFHSGGVHPLVFGAFGETNETTRKIIKLCAKLIASKSSNNNISPIDANGKRGNAYNIIISQLRRAVGCQSMRLAVEEKLRRVQYIRRTPQAARQAAFLNKARQARSRHAPSWFNNSRTNQTFSEFYAYNHDYDDFAEEYQNNKNSTESSQGRSGEQ
mmetsp:Transcript_5394/g.5918  ORF Transcript_5394/g.5918 Transcript_5394/m.5918 type:complete len:374 (-) Transcript_5394:71-1192(-)